MTTMNGAWVTKYAKRYKSRWRALWAAALLIFAAAPAAATSVSPIQLEMTSAGAASRTQVTVTNSSQAPLALETALQRLELGENGEEKLTRAGDEFLVFPPQAMVAPGGTQVFRVQWVGEPRLERSQSFRLALSQIPVKLPHTKSAVQVVMSIGVLVNVAPPQGVPELRLVGTGITAEKARKPKPTITVENATPVHALLEQATVKLSSGSWSQTLSPGEIGQKIGSGLVQPGKRRKFILPIELPPGVTKVEASIDFKPKRS
jgi:fimbrial chaperone protein